MEQASPEKITGKITAIPNPLPLEAGSHTTLHWEVNTPGGAEVCVSENHAAEKLVCRGKSGSVEVDWIQRGREYAFRLYTRTEPRRMLDVVKVGRSDIPWNSLLADLRSGADWQNECFGEIGEFIAGVVSRYLHHPKFQELFRLWEQHGFHVTPVHFYEPVPDTRSLEKKLWQGPHGLVGIDMNATMQRDLLRDVFPQFREEYNQIPADSHGAAAGTFYLSNGRFENIDALIAYCMVRQFRPNQIVEVGGGYSTLLLAQAAQRNKTTSVACIEPYPADFLAKDIPGLTAVIRKKVEDVDLSFFAGLNTGDILFIDSSHVVKIGSDVNFLFLEVLPRLKPGIIVHLHDIFLPFEYPWDWVMEQRRFWTEQYLLQAFLIFNSEFEVLVSSSYLKTHCLEELKAAFPTCSTWSGGSFWMRRKSHDGSENAAKPKI